MRYGADQSFEIQPDLGYLIEDVVVDGESVGPATSYTFYNVTCAHTISASFVNPLDIKVNGSEGPLELPGAELRSLTIGCGAGRFEGTDVDLWLAASTPAGLFYFDLPSLSWQPGLSTIYQGPLVNLPAVEMFELSTDLWNTTGLEEGNYTFYWIGDLSANGALDMDRVFGDIVRLRMK